MDSNEISKVLHADGLADAEKETGRSYKDDKPTMALGFQKHLQNVQARRRLMDELGDTKFAEPIGSYLAIVKGAGFVEVLWELLGDPEYPGHEYYVLWHPDGILMAFDTYWGQVNGGKVYYNWLPADTEKSPSWRLTSSGHQRYKTDKVWVGDHDCREAVLFKMQQLRDNGQLLKKWVERPHLWLVSYFDTKKKDSTAEYYDKVTEARIARLPEHVREAIKGETA